MSAAAPAYAWNSSDYARHSGAQLLWAQELIDRLRPQPGEWLLDVGCGDGKITARLAEQAAPGQVVGVDLSASMVRLARRQFSAPLFCQMDAAMLGLGPVFDAAFSNATLHWVHDHLSVLHGVRRALRPGGRLLFQMGGTGNAAPLVAVLDQLMNELEWRQYFEGFRFPYAFYTPDQYHAWLPQAGLRLVRAELIPKDMRQAGPQGLAGWVRTTWMPYLGRVPEEQRPRFLDQIIERYLQAHPLDAQGDAHVQMVRLEVEALRD